MVSVSNTMISYPNFDILKYITHECLVTMICTNFLLFFGSQILIPQYSTYPFHTLGHTPPCGCGYRNKIVAVAAAVAVAVEPQTATNFQFF